VNDFIVLEDFATQLPGLCHRLGYGSVFLRSRSSQSVK
jgi:hypothetical protein